ncbi:hypothetical protein MSZK_39850 [Mycobacterium sp. shizuoka-1]|nr:hypothetical protein MSZK_39850 [Mycobacterium sp. shizuoka-1]
MISEEADDKWPAGHVMTPAGHVGKRPDADVSRTGHSSYRRSAKLLPGRSGAHADGLEPIVMLRRTLRIVIAMVTAALSFP